MDNLFLIIDATSRLDFSLLTKHRTPGAIPIFGKYRIIDFVISNATKSDITNVGIFTSLNYRSLQDHIGSGDRYDLNRRRDGIFLMPPKFQSPIDEEFASFSRLKDQFEYFRRSHQDYAIITPATAIFSIDYNDLLKKHLETGVDITQVVGDNGERLFTFIIKKSILINYIENASTISFRNIVDVFDQSTSITKDTYTVSGFAKYIRNTHDYYKIFNDSFEDNSPIIDLIYSEPKIRTKDPLNPSTLYSKNAEVTNSFVSSGDTIDGHIDRCALSRRVTIEEGAVVKNSIVMNSCIIRKNAVVENAILDKETEVKEGVTIIGSIDEPFISEKRQIISTNQSSKVVFLCAECSPFNKVGGLADMVSSLSKSLGDLGCDVKVFLPLYRKTKEEFLSEMEDDIEIDIKIGDRLYRINTYRIVSGKLTYVFIDLYMFFDFLDVYGYPNDAYRFTYYSEAVLKYLEAIKYVPDIFHIHDWHPGLLPLLKKKYPIFDKSKTILTIHNLEYQGLVSKDIISTFGLDYYVPGNMLSILEAAINASDIITTVSKTYAEELKYRYYSGDLHDAILRRSSSLYGIVNGLNEKISPKHDLEIKAKYDISNVFTKKEINKKFLCDVCGFKYNPDMFIIGMVTRINETKGFDIVINSLDQILSNEKVYFVLLGVGDKGYMDSLRLYQDRYPGRVRCFLNFYGTNPSYIYSGADCFLMPSRIEPCGTSQMIALRYGTIPIVRQTGGLNDTIDQFDPQTKKGNGFKFFNFDSRDLIYEVSHAIDTYFNDKEGWKELIKSAMDTQTSFEKCTKEYLNLYNIVKRR